MQSKLVLSLPFTFILCAVLLTTTVLADTNPVGCDNNAVGLSFAVYQTDGITPLAGPVQSGETIKYEATLSHAGGSSCNFEDGILTIVTPDGVAHVVVSGTNITLVSSGNPFVAPQQQYVVSEADVAAGEIHAFIDYAWGLSHTVQHEAALASTDVFTDYIDSALIVTKTAVPSSEGSFTWTIDKTADHSNLILSEGELTDVQYEVTVEATSSDSAFAVSGLISIYNPASFADAVITEVSDSISDFGPVEVDCGDAVFPFFLAPDTTLECSYSETLPNGDPRTNTATVETNGDVDGSSGEAEIDFTLVDADTTDECIDVSDDNVGALGEVCADASPHTFQYTLTFGSDVLLACGENEHPNTASFISQDSQTSDEATWLVTASVTCDPGNPGCTLTQGYWKTHSAEGPAPFDDNWNNLPSAEATTFFSSGDSWYDVFWTAPKGNAYYQLAHQYMAAALNVLNGASDASVSSELSDAFALLDSVDPGDLQSPKGKAKKSWAFADESAEAKALAGTLASYNEGNIGPGHCD